MPNNVKTINNAVNYNRKQINQQILNSVRDTNLDYASAVPRADGTRENLTKIGEILEGTPALLEHFTNLLVKVAHTAITSRVFPEFYTQLNKQAITTGGMVEEIFVDIARARDFDPYRSMQREFKRTPPNIANAFHKINWESQYATTVSRPDIIRAFHSETGVIDLTEKIIASLVSGDNLDHRLLVEYLIKKSIVNGTIKALSVGTDDLTELSVVSRATSLRFAMPTRQFSSHGSYTYSPEDENWLVIDADTYARNDVEVLANAFNVDKAKLMGRTIIIDSWENFDYSRFSDIQKAHEQITDFTSEEKAKLSQIKAALISNEAFRIHPVLKTTTSQFVASGLYTNYFLTVQRIYSMSPFSNAVVFVNDAFAPGVPDAISVVVDSVSETSQSIAFSFKFTVAAGKDSRVNLKETQQMVDNEVYVDGGQLVVAKDSSLTDIDIAAAVGDATYSGYKLAITAKPGDVGELSKDA